MNPRYEMQRDFAPINAGSFCVQLQEGYRDFIYQIKLLINIYFVLCLFYNMT